MAKKESCRVKTLSGFMKWVKQLNDTQYLFRGCPKTHLQNRGIRLPPPAKSGQK